MATNQPEVFTMENSAIFSLQIYEYVSPEPYMWAGAVSHYVSAVSFE